MANISLETVNHQDFLMNRKFRRTEFIWNFFVKLLLFFFKLMCHYYIKILHY